MRKRRIPFYVQICSADVVDGLVVHHEGAVGVLQGGVGGQDGVVGLHHSSGHLRGGVDGELQLGLLAVVHRQTLHQQGGETRAGATSEAVEDQESLKPSALVSLEGGNYRVLSKIRKYNWKNKNILTILVLT